MFERRIECGPAQKELDYQGTPSVPARDFQATNHPPLISLVIKCWEYNKEISETTCAMVDRL